MIPLRRNTDVVQFTRDSAERIGRAVRAVEEQVPAGAPLTFETITTSSSRQKPVFRVCTFTGSWSKNAMKTVTLKYVTSTPNTFSVTNLFADVVSATAVRNCGIARDGTAWFLVAAEC